MLQRVLFELPNVIYCLNGGLSCLRDGENDISRLSHLVQIGGLGQGRVLGVPRQGIQEDDYEEGSFCLSWLEAPHVAQEIRGSSVTQGGN